jgi:hypothetical protein
MPKKNNAKPKTILRIRTRLASSGRSNRKPVIVVPRVQNVVVKRKNPKVSRRPRETLSSFGTALRHPFATSTLGVRVPDPYQFQTVTYHTNQVWTIGGATGLTTGCVTFLPSPILSVIDISGVSSNNPCINNAPNSPYVTGVTDARQFIYGATGPTTMKSLLSTFRTCSWGIKISNLMPELTATGRIIVSVIPLGDTIPSYNELTNVALSSDVIASVFGLSASALNSSCTLELETAKEFTASNLMHGDVVIAGQYTNPYFFAFKTPITVGLLNTTTVDGDSSSGLGTVVGFKDVTRCSGGCAINVFFEGFPSTLGMSPFFQVELIYHMEGSPKVNNGSNNVPVPSEGQRRMPGSTSAVEQGMAAVSGLDKAWSVLEHGMDFLGRANDMMNRLHIK